MKMAKKLLAVALAGVLALSVLTGCGDSVSTKKIADALNDMAKADGTSITFTEKSDLNTKAKNVANLLKDVDFTSTEDEAEEPTIEEQIANILGVGTESDTVYAWIALAETKSLNTTAQAHTLYQQIISEDDAINADSFEDKVPADARNIGSATFTNSKDSKSYRLVVVTAAANEAPADED